jgi:ubiquitin-protein ligase
MSRVRLRRLQSDYESMRRLARLHPRITVEGVIGNPPDRYRLVLRVRSLRERGGAIEPADEHRLEIVLPQGYPRDAPLVRMLTPVFHPNIAPHAVCVGDHWSAAEPLDALVQRVGEMLAYQSYNTKSPLNGVAAQWVDQHRDQVPTDREEFFIDLSSAPAEEARAGSCANCGARDVELAPCPAGHEMCGDCQMVCGGCGRKLCLTCGTVPCPWCAAAPVSPS